MRDRPLDELFERFRARGDTAALAEVFDRTAPAHFKVARHLVGRQGDAEDVVQATFLAVIQGASRWDATRPLEPWLFGILVNQAALARRASRRLGPTGFPPETDRRDPGVGSGPDDAAAAKEAARTLESALAGLPPVYREVLAQRLSHDARAVDIARVVGRTPSVVRAQIHRGLALLKRLLPAGLAPAIAVFSPTRRALAAVRATVLEHAASTAGVPLASASVAVGGIVVVKKIALVSVAALVLIGASFWAIESADRGADVGAPRAELPPAVPAVVPPIAPEPRVETARVETAPAPPSATSVSGAPPRAFTAALSGLTGRVLTADGAPLAATRVEMIELRVDMLFSDRNTPFEVPPRAPSLVVGEARTDADGRFLLEGARVHGLHGVAVDPGGPRAQLRIVDVRLSPGRVTDLGDVVLAPTVAWCGTVVDEDGAPVANARVRTVPLAMPLNAVGAEQFRADSVVIDLRLESRQVVPVPSWLDGWIQHLPIASVRTDEDGKFEIAGVPQGSVITVVDHADFVSVATNPEPSGRGTRHDVGRIELPSGRDVAGRVVDGDGKAVAGADVVLGTVAPIGRITFARPVGRTDANGRFACTHVSENGAIVAASRRGQTAAWTIAAPTEDETNVIVTLEKERSHVFVLKDEAGAPVDDVRFRGWTTVKNDPMLTTWTAAIDLASCVEKSAPGTYRIAPLPPEGCLVLVKSASHGVVSRSIDAQSDGGTSEITFRAPRRLKVRVVTKDGGAPVEWADVSAISLSENLVPLARGRTDASGVVDFGAFENVPEIALRTEHPGFAPRTDSLDATAVEWTVTLDSGAAIAGRVSEGGEVPAAPKTIVLFRLGDAAGAEMLEPQITTTDARGDFAFALLRDGTYRWQVYERILAGNPFELITQLDRLRESDAGDVHADAGKETRLDIDLGPRGPQGSAIVRGSVRLDGEPVSGAMVGVSGPREFKNARSGAEGRFEVAELAAGRTSVWLMLETKSDQGSMIEQITSDSFTLANGEVKTLDFDLRSTPVPVRVKAPGGKPARGCQVTAHGVDDETRGLVRSMTTDENGEATLVLFRAGKYRFEARDPSIGRAIATAGVTPGGLHVPVELELEGGVPFAGTFTFEGVHLNRGDRFWLDIVETSGLAEDSLEFDAEVRSFAVKGLPAGTYRLAVRQAMELTEPIEVVMPAQGNTQLRLAFRARAH